MNGIGDLNSSDKGSAARFNAGKPPLHLIPLRIMTRQMYLIANNPRATTEQFHAPEIMEMLAEFQERNIDSPLDYAVMRANWDGNAWKDCAEVFDYGRKKYAAWNWAKGFNWSVVIDSAARHLMAMSKGEVLDPESGLPHRGHVMCNLVMLATFELTHLEGDDRPAAGLLTPNIEINE